MKGIAKLAPGPGHVALVEREERPAGAGEVIITVHAAGVCGTDLHIEAGEFRTAPPVTMGHEAAGVVTEIGEGVDRAWLGAMVIPETYFSTCRTCVWCVNGRPNLCPDRRSIGSFVDGAFAPRLIVPARNLHLLPEGLAPAAAVLIEPLACVCNCLDDPRRVTTGDRVLVTGPGPVGLLAAQVARAQGGEVTVAGLPRDTQRLDAARALGFTTVTDVTGTFDVALECSGAAGGAAVCLDAIARRGRYVQIGVFGHDVTVPLDRLFQKELTMTSGFASTPLSWRRALALVESGAVALAPLVSSIEPLDAWERVFAGLREGQGIKVVFDPRLA